MSSTTHSIHSFFLTKHGNFSSPAVFSNCLNDHIMCLLFGTRPDTREKVWTKTPVVMIKATWPLPKGTPYLDRCFLKLFLFLLTLDVDLSGTEITV